MGYKGLLKGLIADARRAERDAIRRQKTLEKQQLQSSKMKELERASYEVALYENYIERMITLHKDCSENFDWQKIIKKNFPQQPIKKNEWEEEAANVLLCYKPNFFDRLFKQNVKKIAELKKKIEDGKIEDEVLFKESIDKYNIEVEKYNLEYKLAKEVISGNIEFYKIVIQEFDPISEISNIGSKTEFQFINKNKINSIIYIHKSCYAVI